MPSSKLIQPTNLHDCEHACSQSFEVLISDVRNIIENGRKLAYDAVGKVSIATFWNVGKRIVEELQHGDARAEYGTRLIKNLADTIVPLYGSTYSKRNLDYYKKFYLTFPNFEIVNTVFII